MARNSPIITDQYYTPEQLSILQKVSVDPFLFSKFIWVINPVLGRVKFDLYPYQEAVLYHFLKDRFNIILKFRQGGITELISMFCLWLASYHPDKKINIISIKDTIAKKVLRKIKFMYKNLPWYLQTPIVNGRVGEYGGVTEMIFSNGSVIESIPTSEQAGRSESLSLLVIDEAAAVRWAEVIWAAAFPTLATGGAAIINSTPLGIGGWYHRTWTDALAGGNGFNPIRLRWNMHPERDQNWYDQMARALGPRRTAQEIDGDFLGSGNTVFDLIDIRGIEDSLDEYPPISLRFNGQYRQYSPVIPGRKYVIGSDIATGRSDDYSSFTCMDVFGEEHAVYKGRMPMNKYAKLLGDTGHYYNDAIIAPESNDVGIAVTMKLQEEGYPNLYYTTQILKKKRGNRKRKEESQVPGWLTTTKNRTLIIDGLEEDVRMGNVIIKDPFFVQEAYTFIYDSSNRPIALGKRRRANSSIDDGDDTTYSDDDIFGKAITNFVRKAPSYNGTALPQ